MGYKELNIEDMYFIIEDKEFIILIVVKLPTHLFN